MLPEVVELAQQGLVPAGAYGNRESFKERVDYLNKVELEWEDLLFDPQTSGGLLFSLNQDHAEQLVKDLKDLGLQTSIIGEMLPLEHNESVGSVEVTAN